MKKITAVLTCPTCKGQKALLNLIPPMMCPTCDGEGEVAQIKEQARGTVATSDDQPDLPPFQVASLESADDRFDNLGQAVDFMMQLGVDPDEFRGLPYELAVELLTIAFNLSELKQLAADKGIPVGFTVGPTQYEKKVDLIDIRKDA